MPASMMQSAHDGRPTREALLAMFCETATEVVEREYQNITESTRIEELVIDSLGMLEIIGSLERRLRVQIPDESLGGLQTLRDLIDVVESRLRMTAAE